jgi:hypothetical protein
LEHTLIDFSANKIKAVDEIEDFEVRKRQYWKDTHNNEEYTNKNKVDANKFDKININEVNDFYVNLKDCNRNLINYGIKYESEDTTYGLFTYFIYK